MQTDNIYQVLGNAVGTTNQWPPRIRTAPSVNLTEINTAREAMLLVRVSHGITEEKVSGTKNGSDHPET